MYCCDFIELNLIKAKCLGGEAWEFGGEASPLSPPLDERNPGISLKHLQRMNITVQLLALCTCNKKYAGLQSFAWLWHHCPINIKQYDYYDDMCGLINAMDSDCAEFSV